MRVEFTVNFAGHKVTASADVPDELLATAESQRIFAEMLRHGLAEKWIESLDAATERST